MNFDRLDLNLLLVFAAVMRTRSATRAAEELDLTQSAVSNALKRMREQFGDPLFVKTAQGMAPTPLAEQLAPPLQRALDDMRRAIDSIEAFDPATSRRRFCIYMSDLGQLVLVPRLLKVLEYHAPGVLLAVVDTDPRQAHALMADGGIDIAIGTFAGFESGFHRQRLFSKSYVVMARRGHPALQGGLTLQGFLAARHAVYHPPAGSHDDFDSHVEQVFGAHGVKRHVRLELAHGLGIVEAIASSDLLVCVPQRLAQASAVQGGVESAALPFDSPRIDVCQFWHARAHADGGHQWLRALVFKNYSAA